jgi:hypothetical protein
MLTGETQPEPTPAREPAAAPKFVPSPSRVSSYWKAIFTNTWGTYRFPLGCAVLVAFSFGARLAISTARKIAAGQNAAAVRSGLVLAAGTLALIYLLARKRKSRLLEPPPPRTTTSVATQLAVTGALFVVITWLIFTNLDVGSLSRFANATRHDAVVTRVRNGHLYEVELQKALPPLKGGTARSYCGTPRRETCVVFDSLLTNLAVHDRTRVLYIAATHEAFLAGEEWRNFELDAAAFNLGIWLACGVFFAWAIEDLRWNRRLTSHNVP